MILYRGVNCELDEELEGQIRPSGTQSAVAIKYDDGKFKRDGTATYGKSENNAVRAHHIKSGLYNGCYISTTTDYNQAAKFATYNGRKDGFIYHLDTNLFKEYGVISYELPNPKHEEECEVTIRAADNGVIPNEVIVKKEKVYADDYLVG